jgi:hypothetical protein
MNQPDQPKPIMLVKVPLWIKEYGTGGRPDIDCMKDFLTCETGEAIRGLQAELLAVKNGRAEEKILDKVVGPGRKIKFGSYQQWAQYMLLWISSYKG